MRAKRGGGVLARTHGAFRGSGAGRGVRDGRGWAWMGRSDGLDLGG